MGKMLIRSNKSVGDWLIQLFYDHVFFFSFWSKTSEVANCNLLILAGCPKSTARQQVANCRYSHGAGAPKNYIILYNC